MYAIILLTLLHAVTAQSTTSCPACDNLLSLWDPNSNTGSCLGSISDPVAYIVGAEQCLCGTQGQNDYSACVACNINGDGGVPIDGLNFGDAAGFQTACSIFASDVTSVLESSGLNAFASVVAEALTATNPLSADILGYYIFQNVVSATGLTGLITDTVGPAATPTATPAASPTATGTTTTANTQTTRTTAAGTESKASTTIASSLATGTHSSESGKNRFEASSFAGILVVVALAAIL
jgi:hypothetical protein